MATDNALLENLTKDGKMNYAEWPGLLDRLLPRLERIAYNDFPTPSIPLPGPLPPSLKEEPFRERPSIPEKSQDTRYGAPGNEEQAAIKADSLTEDSKFAVKREFSPPTTSNLVLPPANTLPPPLLSLLSTIQSSLRTGFPTAPPHTAQRLAELLLHPTRHYKTLPSYLRALDRIVSVASPASVFPLPTLTPAATTNGRLLNGTSSPSPDPADRDFIGGAELTEIPWIIKPASNSPTPSHNGPTTTTTTSSSDLRTESTSLIDGPNGAGSIVTVNVNGVHLPPRDDDDDSNSSHTITHGITQGELLRQEQEAGIVPVPNGRVTRSSAVASSSSSSAATLTDSSSPSPDDMEPEPVHARGPDVIGMEDTGPQAPGSGASLTAGGGGRMNAVEAALGRRGEGENMAAAAAATRAAVGRPTTAEEEAEGKDGEGDMVVVDADGVAEGDEDDDNDGRAVFSRENKGADAVDSTAL